MHDVQDAPEHFLFVLDVHQEHSSYIVHALNVANLAVVVAVSQQHVVEHLLALLTFPIEILAFTFETFKGRRVVGEGSGDIFSDSVLISWICNTGINQLLVDAFVMHRFLPGAAAEHAPYLTSQIWWYAIQERLAHSLS